MRTWWKKVVRWLISPPGARVAAKVRPSSPPKPVNLSFRDVWLTDTDEAKRARGDLYAAGLHRNIMSGPWWMSSPLMTAIGVGSWWMRRRRRRLEEAERREMKRAAERHKCDGL
jgi:hypothetical protein